MKNAGVLALLISIVCLIPHRFWYFPSCGIMFFGLFIIGQTLLCLSGDKLSDLFWRIPLTIGATLNGIAVVSNGGYMPVSEEFFKEEGTIHEIWCLADANTRFLPLCDIYPGGTSIGDFILLSSFAIGFIVFLWKLKIASSN